MRCSSASTRRIKPAVSTGTSGSRINMNADTIHRTSLLHQKMTEAGFPLTEISEIPDGFAFAFAGPEYYRNHLEQGTTSLSR